MFVVKTVLLWLRNKNTTTILPNLLFAPKWLLCTSRVHAHRNLGEARRKFGQQQSWRLCLTRLYGAHTHNGHQTQLRLQRTFILKQQYYDLLFVLEDVPTHGYTSTTYGGHKADASHFRQSTLPLARMNKCEHYLDWMQICHNETYGCQVFNLTGSPEAKLELEGKMIHPVPDRMTNCSCDFWFLWSHGPSQWIKQESGICTV